MTSPSIKPITCWTHATPVFPAVTRDQALTPSTQWHQWDSRLKKKIAFNLNLGQEKSIFMYF